jgi:uncharacterized protein YndB with AHSA1/START domain
VASATVTRTIAAPQAQVWAALSDIANARRWNSSWSQIEFTSTQTHGVGAAFRAHTDDGDVFNFEITGWVAPEYIEFSPVRDESEDYSITLESHTFRLQALTDSETRIDLTAHASARGIRGRFIAVLFWPGYQKRGLNLALDAIEALFEPKPQPEATPAVD